MYLGYIFYKTHSCYFLNTMFHCLVLSEITAYLFALFVYGEKEGKGVGNQKHKHFSDFSGQIVT